MWPRGRTGSRRTRAADLRASVFERHHLGHGLRDHARRADAAAGLAGRFAPAWRVPARSLRRPWSAVCSSGTEPRIAYGCNIGAYFSGIASSSVHGWVWFVAAFIGNVLGTKLRPLFGLRV